jgi:hypothetical protein
MRYSFALLLVAALPASAQFLSFGVTAGVPLTDAFSTGRSAYASTTSYDDRFIIGPTLDLRLAPRFWFETGALYRRNGFRYSVETGTANLNGNEWFQSSGQTAVSHGEVAVDDWQFPFLGKYELHGGPLRPFVDVGFTLRHISNAPNSNVGGGTFGGGLSVRLLGFRIEPQIRYTRWGSHAFNYHESEVLVSDLNQVDFLVGLMF